MDIENIILVPSILFMIFVAPVWVIMHYRAKRQIGQGLTETELSKLDELTQKAEKMSERIKTLEALLDAESPNWRNQ